MKYFVFSDVHGCFKPLKAALRNAGYDENDAGHHLIFLGDAFDKDSAQRDDYGVYSFLKTKVESGKLTWIIGNHDVYLRDLQLNSFTEKTVKMLADGLEPGRKHIGAECLSVLKAHGVDRFIKTNCVNYYETENYVFTHAFIPYDKTNDRYDKNWRQSVESKGTIPRTQNGMKLVMDGIRIPGKTLVCGHVGAYYGNITLKHPEVVRDSDEFNKIKDRIAKTAATEQEYFKTFYGDGVIGVDGWGYKTGVINVFVAEDQKEGEHDRRI